MMYKIIQKSKVIDVVRNPNFIRFLLNDRITFTDKASAHGIIGSDTSTLYSFGIVDRPDIEVVSIEKITEEEFNRLQSLLNSNQTVTADTIAVKKARREKIEALSAQCNNKITEGFTIILQDRKNYYFTLTAEDQLNLLNLENQLNAGGQTFIYHAASQPCRVFSKAEMTKIIKAYRKHVLYHTTYFNTVKHYINTLTDVEKIEAFTYGEDVAGRAKDPTIRRILREGGKL